MHVHTERRRARSRRSRARGPARGRRRAGPWDARQPDARRRLRERPQQAASHPRAPLRGAVSGHGRPAADLRAARGEDRRGDGRGPGRLLPAHSSPGPRSGACDARSRAARGGARLAVDQGLGRPRPGRAPRPPGSAGGRCPPAGPGNRLTPPGRALPAPRRRRGGRLPRDRQARERRLLRAPGLRDRRPSRRHRRGELVHAPFATRDRWRIVGDRAGRHPAAIASDPAVPPLSGSQLRLLAPIPDPGKLIGIGLYYRSHAREAGLDPPATAHLLRRERATRRARARAHPDGEVMQSASTADLIHSIPPSSPTSRAS